MVQLGWNCITLWVWEQKNEDMNLIHDHGSELGQGVKQYQWKEPKSLRTRQPGTVGMELYHQLVCEQNE